MTPREHYAGKAMAVLMIQQPNATRGWIAEMAWQMADVMAKAGDKDRGLFITPDAPFADTPRVFAEDEP